ncbi:hypothetical protein J2S74_005388 [Evansella vedderi]|uniref:Amino acid transporter n=1 Tax=Evansella vedderi TaxID=38282 RepID=A0ABU0A351_9BACI|nr:hypothetical protein [Evansella vedderi]MDQ0257925.1 hypothetical protein [Evansella vedderi]
MNYEFIDFREFVSNKVHPQPEINDLKTHSVFSTGYIIIGLTCVFAVGIGVAENVLVRMGNDHIAETIVRFMKVFMPITLLAALAILAFMNPLF